jgi:hypothetical protein
MFFAFLNAISSLLNAKQALLFLVFILLTAIGGRLKLFPLSLEARDGFLVHFSEQKIRSNLKNFIKMTTIMNDILSFFGV